MATSDEILAEISKGASALNNAADLILNASAEFEPSRLLAEGALQKSGGTMSGPVSNLTLAGLNALSYDASAVSGKQVMDFAPQKAGENTELHVNSDVSGASDTDGLGEGRGLSADMPFLSLGAAINWGTANFGHGLLSITLHSDAEFSGQLAVPPGLKRLQISAEDGQYKIRTSGISVPFGCLLVHAVKFEAKTDSISFFLESIGNSGISMLCVGSNVSFTGKVTQGTLVSSLHGYVSITGSSSFPGSSVTGPRYKCVRGSQINWNGCDLSKIPGTTAGTCDSTSVLV